MRRRRRGSACFVGSTRVPNSVTTWRSTSTRPAVISSSHWRRLPSPAEARTFCRRCMPSSAGGLGLAAGRRGGAARGGTSLGRLRTFGRRGALTRRCAGGGRSRFAGGSGTFGGTTLRRTGTFRGHCGTVGVSGRLSWRFIFQGGQGSIFARRGRQECLPHPTSELG